MAATNLMCGPPTTQPACTAPAKTFCRRMAAKGIGSLHPRGRRRPPRHSFLVAAHVCCRRKDADSLLAINKNPFGFRQFAHQCECTNPNCGKERMLHEFEHIKNALIAPPGGSRGGGRTNGRCAPRLSSAPLLCSAAL